MQTHTCEGYKPVFIQLFQLKNTFVLYRIAAFVNMELQKMFTVITIETSQCTHPYISITILPEAGNIIVT